MTREQALENACLFALVYVEGVFDDPAFDAWGKSEARRHAKAIRDALAMPLDPVTQAAPKMLAALQRVEAQACEIYQNYPGVRAAVAEIMDSTHAALDMSKEK